MSALIAVNYQELSSTGERQEREFMMYELPFAVANKYRLNLDQANSCIIKLGARPQAIEDIRANLLFAELTAGELVRYEIPFDRKVSKAFAVHTGIYNVEFQFVPSQHNCNRKHHQEVEKKNEEVYSSSESESEQEQKQHQEEEKTSANFSSAEE
jgi:hypothetical protein